jgi:hypothetical protein
MDGMAEWQNRPLDRGQVLVIVANPEDEDSDAEVCAE